MNERERILEKIRRLISLSGHTATPIDESRNAGREACLLMMAHKIGIAETPEAPAKPKAQPKQSVTHDAWRRHHGAGVVDHENPAEQQWGDISKKRPLDSVTVKIKLKYPQECFICTKRYFAGQIMAMHTGNKHFACADPRPCEDVLAGRKTISFGGRR